MKETNNENRKFQVLAKSKPEISLEDHIVDCLHVAEQFPVCFPLMPLKEHKEFWKLLSYSVIFHDTGKAHQEFQRILYGISNDHGRWYNQRHELFSLYFVYQANLYPDLKEKNCLCRWRTS